MEILSVISNVTRIMTSMTSKKRPTATVLFLAILPVGAWVAVLYFCIVIIESGLHLVDALIQVGRSN